jgi:signal transduction histidine kinase
VSSSPPDEERFRHSESSIAYAGDVLVVDDNDSNLLAIETALDGLGARVLKARSGAEALRHLLDQDFALILLDVQMPTMDGLQTARMIRKRQRSAHTPIIFITAYDRDDRDVLAGYALGAVDFLFKPVVAQILRAKASVFLDLWRRTAELERKSRLLWQHERRAHEQRLVEERRRWEAEALRRQMEQERQVAVEQRERAQELSHTVRERERAERDLMRINQELAESDRRKDEFLAVLAHELRNPLAPIVTSLELLRVALPDVPGPAGAVVRAREAMERQVKHLRRLVDDLLDLSRINSGKIELRREPMLLSQLIEQATATSQPLIAEGGHTLHIDLPSEDVVLDADVVRMTQVISNLLNNAARYTEPHGEIFVSAEQSGDDAVIRVRDTGQGIAPEMLASVFDMFVQERKDARGGSGLGIGLTLVKTLVEMHGGRVVAKSGGPGKGSEFELRIPTGKSQAKPDLPARSAPAAEPRALRVVLIDDYMDIRETVGMLLEMWGHEVETADNGSDGADLIVRVKPDIALIDIGLPGFDGYAVAKRVRAQLPNGKVKLIAMTGYGRERDRESALNAGFDDHLTKPVAAEVLQAALALHGACVLAGMPDATRVGQPH